MMIDEEKGEKGGGTRSGPKKPAAAFGVGGNCWDLSFMINCDSFWFIITKKIKNFRIFSNIFFEAVLASKWPQRPNLTAPLALSLPITPSYHFHCPAR